MSRRTAIWLGVAAAITVAAVGFWAVMRDGTATDRDTVTVGVISPFSGEGAIYGKAARSGIDLAVDEINHAGGVGGIRLVMKYEDDKGNPRDALSAFEKLASIDKVPAVLGPFYSGNVLACAPAAERLRVVLLTGSGTSDNIRDAGEYTFRTCPSNDAQAKTIAQFASETLKLRTAFIIYRNAEYGVTLRDAFQNSADGLGIQVVGVEAVPADSPDVRPQLVKIKAANPDFIFAAVHAREGGALLRQAKELGIGAVVIGTDGASVPELLQIAGDAAEGSYWTTIGWGDEASNPAVERFKEAYRKRYNEDPGVYSGLYYDATHVLAKSLVAVGPAADGAAVQKALLSAQYEGPTGVTKFDARGEVDKPFAVYQVRGGDFKPVGSQR